MCGLSESDIGVEWLERYARIFEGHIVTNFDQQEPAFADAPLSYQRLVAKTSTYRGRLFSPLIVVARSRTVQSL
jgi:hypothetical protein